MVPQGSSLEGGAVVNWSGVDNVTAVASIPNISAPNGTVYAILSLMTTDGTVMQTAIGIYPGSHLWKGYSLYIVSISAVPQTYHWVANSSLPESLANQTVSLTLSRDQEGSWSYRISNLATRVSLTGAFGPEVRGAALREDQEIFALESYTSDPRTFGGMGNMTLQGVFLNGARAVGPLYTYGGWDPSHTLPFVVGGLDPPTFIGVKVSVGGIVNWVYTGTSSQYWGYDGRAPQAFLAVGAVTVGAGIVVSGVRLLSRSTRR
ncbi:MAG TPA: hypothetical protein VFE91_06700 [Nitrososphaerales archaeon]|nr:hypothetical protein [Nitrososphaerales archaeon]